MLGVARYLESPDGLKKRKEAILNQLARLECCANVSAAALYASAGT